MPDSSSDHKIQLQQLTESLHDAFEAVAIQHQDQSSSGKRRASLPENPFSSLKRTISHKSFPHLTNIRVKSTPFHFSPKTNVNNESLHLSRSHCNLPHLPAGLCGSKNRRASLPKDFESRCEKIRQRERRGSFPLDEETMKQRRLHRCKANHKANITMEDMARELTKNRAGAGNPQQGESTTPTRTNIVLKRVKSEPALSKDLYDRNESVKGIEKAQSKSFHDSKSGQVVHVHHIDSRFLESSAFRGSAGCKSNEFSILSQISENVVS